MKKILVVEDEYYARKSIVKILQESDLDIQVCGEAENGMKAIDRRGNLVYKHGYGCQLFYCIRRKMFGQRCGKWTELGDQKGKRRIL